MSDDSDDKLRRALASLPRELPPEVDLWPAIANRISRPESRQGEAFHRRWGLAAALVGLVLGGALVQQLTAEPMDPRHSPNSRSARRSPSTSTAEQDLLPHERTFRLAIADLRNVYERRRPAIDPTLTRLFDDELVAVGQAVAHTRSALADDPRDPHLQAMLSHAYDHQLQLLKQAASVAGED